MSISLKKDWVARPTIFYSGFMFQLGDVLSIVEHRQDRGHSYYEATLHYSEGRRLKNTNRSFVSEEDAREWCILESLKMHGYQAERIITINGMERSMPQRTKFSKSKTKKETMCKVSIDAGKTKIRTQMSQKDARDFMELLRQSNKTDDHV